MKEDIYLHPSKVAQLSANHAMLKQVNGDYYVKLPIQPIEYIYKNNLTFLQGNVVKYITRYKSKNGPDDIKKAIHYCELILDLEYGDKK